MYPLIRRQAERVRGDDGIVFYNFDDTDIPERRPTKGVDAVMPTVPLLVFHHISIPAANSKALERIGVNPDAPFDDVNVFLGKDGLPNGYIAEEMAFKAMGELMPALDQERHKALVRECVAEYNAQGFTSAHDSAVGIPGLGAEPERRNSAVGNRQPERREQDMPHLTSSPRIRRAEQCVYLATMEQPFRRLEPTGLLDGPGNRFVQYSAVKTLADGSIQAGPPPSPKGFLRPLAQAGHHRHAGLLGRDGLPLAFAGPPAFHPLQRRRGHRNHHHGGGTGAGPLPPQGRPASDHPLPDGDRRACPAHEGGGHPALVLWAARLELGRPALDIFLGPDRAARLDPAGSAVRAGLPFSLHADTPVLPQMTMLSIHTAVNRETKGGAVLGPDQRISTLEAVRAYTSYAALFSHSEAWRGTIEPGKVADFVIPSEDILEAPAGRLKGITFAAAIVDNRVVHGQLP